MSLGTLATLKGVLNGRRRWRGHIDSVINGSISGWAVDLSEVGAEVEVAALSSSGKRAAGMANIFREDLKQAGFGNGCHAFLIDISSWKDSDGFINVVFAKSGLKLNRRPIKASGFAERTGLSSVIMSDDRRWRGHVDSFDRNSATGWAIDTLNVHRRIDVEAVSAKGRRIRGMADIFREDLKDAGFGDGYHGFKLDLRTFGEPDCPIDIVAVEGKEAINKHPLHFDLFEMIQVHEPPESIRRLIVAASQAIEHAGAAAPPVPMPGTETSNAERSRWSTLFETAQPDRDPEGIVSKFLQYESFRIEREKDELAMEGTLQERLRVLMWYLTKYLRDRQYLYHLPLSAAQTSFLNGPVPIAGYPPAVSVALFNFVHHERPDLADLTDLGVLRSTLFWWCCERMPHDKLDASLTTKAMVEALTSEEQWTGEPFPFNFFMAEYFNRHTELHDLDMRRPIDRAIFFVYLVLKSFTEPYVQRFLSRDMLRLVLREKDGVAHFDRAVSQLSGGKVNGSSVRRHGEALLASHGFALRQPQTHEGRDFGECFLARLDLTRPPQPGVALIGPIAKASGLGQATRLSHEVLKTAETVRPSTLAFDLDNPAPVGFASDLDSEPYRDRREINLIHLNGESIPLVYAFEQKEILASSYNIGYFFWELNVIPKCHHLSLELLDEIWVSSEYNREIYARYTDKPVVNVGMAVEPLPKVVPADRDAFGLKHDAMIFLSTFDSFSFIERKNPLGVLEAFHAAFPDGDEPVQLVLKTQNRGRVFDPYQMDLWKRIDRAVSEDPRIIVVNETLRYRDLLALKLACDCYVSLHRSEGWGFGMLEAMNLGRPVIATGYSGNMDFCTPDTSFLVDYDLVGVREAEYIFVERGSMWAQPRREHAAMRMREVAGDPAAARARGATAAAHIEAKFSIAAIARRYGARLAEIRAMRG